MNDRAVQRLIRKLKKLEVEWFYDEWGHIVCYMDNTLFCPLTALYYKKTGHYLPRRQGVEAGRRLHYREDVAEYITRLADDDMKLPEYMQTNFYEQVEMFKRLIK